MTAYAKDDLLTLAKRRHNTKRTYLLVNPLQGKHIPVSPGRALEMMRALGARMAEMEPGIDLVIGFAETATAVAAAVAWGMGRPCHYIHTTREAWPGGEAVEFREEHSHAVEQRLCLARLGAWIEDANAIALVDDELSTGRPLFNAVDQLAKACPAICKKRLVAASLISRLSDAREAELAEQGIRCLSLLRLPLEDYTEAVRRFEIEGARMPAAGSGEARMLPMPPTTEDARLGVALKPWLTQLRSSAREIAEALRSTLAGRRVTVLGTEEYMRPGLMLGRQLEAEGIAERVRFHATTRSPIGICTAPGYPIRSGWQLHSFYDESRPTFIYDLEPCDAAVILTDSPDDAAVRQAVRDLALALGEAGCRDVTLIREACHVQHL